MNIEPLSQEDEFGWLHSDGEMSHLIKNLNWQHHPLGSPRSWPSALKTALNLCLGSRYPMFIWWSEEFYVFYNDAYIPIAGPDKHPAFLGKKASEQWADIWDVVGPLAQSVYVSGQATWNENLPLFMHRRGFMEETYFTFSYSPCVDEQGKIFGVFCACQETTNWVLNERRLKTLRELGLREAQDLAAAVDICRSSLMINPKDIPFFAIFLKRFESHRDEELDLVCQSGITQIEAETIFGDLVTHVHGHMSGFHEWESMPDSVFISSLDNLGYVVYGLSSKLEFDQSYQGFLELANHGISNIFNKVFKEQIIIKNEQRLNLVLTSSRIGFWDWNLKTHQFILSDQLKEDLGLDVNESNHSLQKILSLIHEDDIDFVQSTLERVFRVVDNYEMEFRVVRPQGIIWLHAKGRSLADNDGKPIRMMGTTLDVTQQRQLYEVVLASENQFRRLAESMPQIVWTAGPDGNVNWYNNNWYTFTGLKIGESWTNALHPDDLKRTVQSWDRAVLSGELYENEYRFRNQKGDYRWMLGRAVPLKDQEGKILQWFGTNTDIHDKMEVRQILERKNRLFQMITETIPQGIWRTDPDGSADYISSRFSQQTGYSDEVMLGWGWTELLHPLDRPRVLTEWEKARRDGASVSLEFRIRQPDGTYRWFLSQGNPFKNEDGMVEKYYGTWTDIEDQKRYQERLKQALNARDEFLSVASHELKTPLTSLKLQTQIFQRSLKKGEPLERERVYKLLHHTDQVITRLTRLVDDMLDISRIRTGKLQIHKTETNICQLVQDVVEGMRPHFSSVTQIQLNCPEEIRIEVDIMRIEQVLMNLLTNALKYGENKPVVVVFEDRRDNVILKVQDQGVGIEKENVDRIFDRFERAVSANEVSGLGLGLYITKQIVLAHGGKIWVESKLGKGATFYVSLPKHLH